MRWSTARGLVEDCSDVNKGRVETEIVILRHSCRLIFEKATNFGLVEDLEFVWGERLYAVIAIFS